MKVESSQVDMSWSLMKTGTNDPRAGRIKNREVHLEVAQAPLTLKIKNRSTDAIMRPKEIKLVEKMLLHTM